jgi:hypothetical protein
VFESLCKGFGIMDIPFSPVILIFFFYIFDASIHFALIYSASTVNSIVEVNSSVYNFPVNRIFMYMYFNRKTYTEE